MAMIVDMSWILESGDFLGTFFVYLNCTPLSVTGDSRLHRVIIF